MISVDQARHQADDMLNAGDPHRAIVVMTTPFKLAVLSLHLSSYVEAMKGAADYTETMLNLNEIGDDLQKVVVQILQQEYPSNG